MKTKKALAVIALLAGLQAQAVIQHEWTYQKDRAGTLPAGAINSGADGSAVFGPGAAGVLEADGLGALLSTPTAPNLWDDGATVSAALADTNTLFMRYDLNYDLSSGTNTVGTSVGISFVDSTGTNVAGLIFSYDPSGSAAAPAGIDWAAASPSLPLTGTLSAIAQVSTTSLSVWYSTNGIDFFPGGSSMAVSLSSISSLRIQATGQASPAGSGDFVAVENIRVADTWESISGAVQASVAAKYLNEWLFDRDVAGRTLSEAINSGTDGAVFSADTIPVTQTDGTGGLICRNDAADTGSLWDNGAVLRADVTNQSAGVRFLRYDLAYDMTAATRNTGTLLGLGFSDAVGTNLAGIALTYGDATPPAGIDVSQIPGPALPPAGTLSVIAKVDLDAKTLEAWYDLTGSNSFSASNAPGGIVSGLNLTTIEQLEFRATGDLIASASNECVVIDNIRTSATWTEIIEPIQLLSPLTVTITGSQGMAIGGTNLISVTLHNSGAEVTAVSSILSHNAGSGLSIISSNNAAVTIPPGGSVVQTYQVVGNTGGQYTLTVQATVAGINSGVPVTFNLLVGPRISYLPSYILSNESGWAFPGEAEPGESFDLTITSINDGGQTAHNVTNSLIAANPAFFPGIALRSSNIYGTLPVNATASTTYRVTCADNTPNGMQTFYVINRTADTVWTNEFELYIRAEEVLPLSTNALTIRVAEGHVASATFSINNIDTMSKNYFITDNGSAAIDRYAVSLETEIMKFFDPVYDEPDAATTFISWETNDNGTVVNGTVAQPIGFSFPFFDGTYANFSVSKYGAISFGSAVGANSTTTLPSGTQPVVAPFWGSTAVDTNSVRYDTKYPGMLVVSWANETGKEFQAWLYQNGSIRYLYEYGTWTDGAIGGQRTSTIFQNLDYLPGNENESVLLTPVRWVTYSPTSGVVAPHSRQFITVTADATRRTPGTFVTTVLVNLGGTTYPLTVTLIVEAADPLLTVDPESVAFSGPAGWLAKNTTMTVSNAGNITLNYTITDLGAQANGYSVINDPDLFSWDTSHWDEYSVDAVPLLNDGDDKTDWIPFGFSFPFYGNVYTNFKIDANEGIVLNSPSAITGGYDRVVAAYFPVDLDENAILRYSGDGNKMVVTWENMGQVAWRIVDGVTLVDGGYQEEAANQTFQLIAYRDGRIKLQYLSVGGTNLWPNSDIYLRDTLARAKTASLVRPGIFDEGNVTYSNNVTYTYGPGPYDEPVITGSNVTVVTTYDETVAGEAILFYPPERTVISAEPKQGTLPVGEARAITLYGDARSLTAGGSSDVVVSTTFDVSSVAPTVSVPVTFTATNSVESTYEPMAAMAAVMWGGDEVPDLSSKTNPDGSRTLSWPAALDSLSRTYIVWYTTSLSTDWIELAVLKNTTSYVDDDPENMKEPVIFYKVTVQ